jgi:hypothetical protein
VLEDCIYVCQDDLEYDIFSSNIKHSNKQQVNHINTFPTPNPATPTTKMKFTLAIAASMVASAAATPIWGKHWGEKWGSNKDDSESPEPA